MSFLNTLNSNMNNNSNNGPNMNHNPIGGTGNSISFGIGNNPIGNTSSNNNPITSGNSNTGTSLQFGNPMGGNAGTSGILNPSSNNLLTGSNQPTGSNSNPNIHSNFTNPTSNTGNPTTNSTQTQNLEQLCNDLRKQINENHYKLEADRKNTYIKIIEDPNKGIVENYKFLSSVNSLNDNTIQSKEKPLLPVNTLYKLMRNLNLMNNVKQDFSVLPLSNLSGKKEIDLNRLPNLTNLDPLVKRVYDDYIECRQKDLEDKKKQEINSRNQCFEAQYCRLLKKNEIFFNCIVNSKDDDNEVNDLSYLNKNDEYSVKIHSDNLFLEKSSNNLNGLEMLNNSLASFDMIDNKGNLDTKSEAYSSETYNNFHNKYTSFQNKGYTPLKTNQKEILFNQANKSTIFNIFQQNEENKQMGINVKEKKPKLLEDFYFYFKHMKKYFCYMLTGHLDDTTGYEAEGKEFIHLNKFFKSILFSISNDLKKNMNTNKIFHFETQVQVNTSFDELNKSKIKLFGLLDRYFSNICSGENYLKEKKVFGVVVNSVKFLQSNFFMSIISNDEEYEKRLNKHTNEVYNDPNFKLIYNNSEKYSFHSVSHSSVNLEDNEKIKFIESYVNNTLFKKDYIKKIDFVNKKELISWAKIFYILRCGFDSILNVYLKSYSSSEETQALLVLTEFNSYVNSKYISTAQQSLKEDMGFYQKNYKILLSYYNNLEKERQKNPFQIAVISIVLKISTEIDREFFDSMDDYFWYYLRIISVSEDNIVNFSLNINETSESLKENKLNLEDFQEFIINSNFESNVHNDFELLFYFFSIGLFKKGLEQVLSTTKLYVDIFHVAYFLNETGLLSNFCDSNRNLLYYHDNFGQYNEKFYTAELEAFIFRLLQVAKDEKTLKQILPYLCTNSFQVELGKRYVESKKENIKKDIYFNHGVDATKFTQLYPNFVFKSLLEKFIHSANLIKLFNCPNEEIFNNKVENNEHQQILGQVEIYQSNYSKVTFSNIVGNCDLYKDLIYSLIENKIKFNKDSLAEIESLDLCVQYKNYNELLSLLTKNFILLINGKTLRSNINEVNTQRELVIYKVYLDIIGVNINSDQFSRSFKNNYDFLCQLLEIEKIFNYVNEDLQKFKIVQLPTINKCFDLFDKYLKIFPENSNGLEINEFFNRISDWTKELINFLPEVFYLYYCLSKDKLEYLNKNSLITCNSKEGQAVREARKALIKRLATINDLLEEIKNKKLLFEDSKIEEISKLITDVTTRYMDI